MLRLVMASTIGLALLCSCNPAKPPETAKVATSAEKQPSKAEPLPSDLPIPPGMNNRSDSGLPNSKYHVIQGSVSTPLPDTIETLRKLAKSNAWSEAVASDPGNDPAIAMLTFEKDSREFKATLIRRSNTETALNLLTGPK